MSHLETQSFRFSIVPKDSVCPRRVGLPLDAFERMGVACGSKVLIYTDKLNYPCYVVPDLELTGSEMGVPRWLTEYITSEVKFRFYSDYSKAGKIKVLKLQLLKGNINLPTTEGLNSRSRSIMGTKPEFIDWEDKLKRNLADYPVEKGSLFMMKVFDEPCIFRVLETNLSDGEENGAGFVERANTHIELLLGDEPSKDANRH
ncbi:hypothetical protein K493DRAFT_81541 [Basidiobolus meristosporus CBS 931.73]|uniref:Uncharacterized protein n=1 Tax=Basidiobolus meristosporus CBS 931.73 TaxID=1314790 RepID=A0A1Y1XND0_9FUNG|nr:hypothetical protein K493DRAFT_81541 [Basidiobolus meristosporus CBS 931.73]|eukprot:ORX87175.1 hypothetical protein K493DRAFT_81541 [Basidiobolus meristosporus CBS 931.73]